MPNRFRYRPRVIDSFILGEQLTCSFLLRVSAARDAKPALQNFCSAAWEVQRGEGWLVYQLPDGDWSLSFLFPKRQFGIYVDQPYFVIPSHDEDLWLLGTTFYEQLDFQEELRMLGCPIPQEAFVHFPAGEIISMGEDWIEIQTRQQQSQVYWPDDKLDELQHLAQGDTTEPFRYEVDILSYIDWAHSGELEFNPRIIDLPQQPIGCHPADDRRTAFQSMAEHTHTIVPEYLSPFRQPNQAP